MPYDSVQVTTPSRLHFGLLSFGGAAPYRFGGAGMMIAPPQVALQFTRASRLEIVGLHAVRVDQFVQRWWAQAGQAGLHVGETACVTSAAELPCRIEVSQAPPQHVGLGLGTQLGLAVAVGLQTFFDQRRRTLAELAELAGRGKRSGVGCFGFARGGFLLETGRPEAGNFPQLRRRVEVPSGWRFLLLRPPSTLGLSGNDEQQAFQQLPAVPDETRSRLLAEAENALLPALESADCAAFGESLYRFGYLAGLCYADQQGGPFNGPLTTHWVNRLRSWGVHGVGQSSWGPTIFALLPDESAAIGLLADIRREPGGDAVEVTLAAPCNQGAQLRLVTEGQPTVTRPAVVDFVDQG